jgi:hypothetical protein
MRDRLRIEESEVRGMGETSATKQGHKDRSSEPETHTPPGNIIWRFN